MPVSAPSSADVHIEDIEYVRHSEGPLLARMYRPKGDVTGAALVSLHGGRWVRESRLSNAAIDEALARDGNLVMAIDIRMPPVARYPDCLADINAAIRWLKHAAAGFGVRPDLVGGIGTSSGGHQIMLSAMRPHDPRYVSPSVAGAAADATLAFVVICWPVVDPLSRYKMAKAKAMADHVAAHDAYWPSEEAMAEGNPQLILQRGEPAQLPPALLVQGTADSILPPDMATNFATAYRKAGGTLDLCMFEGQPHTFITKDPNSAASKSALRVIANFVRYRTALLQGGGIA